MIEQNVFTIIFGVFVLFTCRDMIFGHPSEDDAGDHLAKGPVGDHYHHHHHHAASPASGAVDPMAGPMGVPTIKIQYCHSCGYRQAYEEIAKMLLVNYPNIKVEGELHHPNWLRSQIVNLLFITKIAVLAMIYMNFNPFTYMQVETPSLWTRMVSNKVSSSLIILFIASSIDSKLMSTGAFEIYFNDNIPLWSKLQTGRIPSGPELLQIVGSQLNFVTKSKLGEFVPT